MNRTALTLAFFSCVLTPGCGGGASPGDEAGAGFSSVGGAGGRSAGAGGSGAGGSSAGGSGTMPGAGGGIQLNQGGSSAGNPGHASGGFDPGTACVGQSAEGERVAVDLYFMVDTTGSMNCPVPDSPSRPCEVDPGAPYAATTRWVVESAALKGFMSAPANAGMGVGIDFFPSARDMCKPASYVSPTVEIGLLPGAASALNAAISAQKPAGNTPTVASLTGAIQHASAWAKKTGHRVAVVYSTDGYPKGCEGEGNTIANATSVARNGFQAEPSIETFVLGMGQNLSSLEEIARAGGTEHAYLIDTNQDAAAQLSAAFESIRGRTQVSCEYTIPPPPIGETLDYSKVNVHYTNSTGTGTDFAQDPSASCVDGWQYSPDKKQVLLCGAACDVVKADIGGSLQIRFGCATKVEIPR